MRINKFLSNCGVGSRRAVEKYIIDGRVSSNGIVIGLGHQVKENDLIRLDQKIIYDKNSIKSLIYNKPIGEICSRKDPKFDVTVFDKLPKVEYQRWVSIGRLDLNTSGLLIFTTDGNLANYMMHPSNKFEREYKVCLTSILSDKDLYSIQKGIIYNNIKYNVSSIKFYKHNNICDFWYKVVICEGKNREIRNVFLSLGKKIKFLKRIRFGNVILPKDLSERKCRYINLEDLTT